MLLFANGYIEYNYTNQATFDEYGNPIKDENPTSKVRCSYQVTKENRNTLTIDGVMHLISYTIDVDANSVPNSFAPTSITLIPDRVNSCPKQYSVKQIQYYDLTKSIRIWV